MTADRHNQPTSLGNTVIMVAVKEADIRDQQCSCIATVCDRRCPAFPKIQAGVSDTDAPKFWSTLCDLKLQFVVCKPFQQGCQHSPEAYFHLRMHREEKEEERELPCLNLSSQNRSSATGLDRLVLN